MLHFFPHAPMLVPRTTKAVRLLRGPALATGLLALVLGAAGCQDGTLNSVNIADFHFPAQKVPASTVASGQIIVNDVTLAGIDQALQQFANNTILGKTATFHLDDPDVPGALTDLSSLHVNISDQTMLGGEEFSKSGFDIPLHFWSALGQMPSDQAAIARQVLKGHNFHLSLDASNPRVTFYRNLRSENCSQHSCTDASDITGTGLYWDAQITPFADKLSWSGSCHNTSLAGSACGASPDPDGCWLCPARWPCSTATFHGDFFWTELHVGFVPLNPTGANKPDAVCESSTQPLWWNQSPFNPVEFHSDDLFKVKTVVAGLPQWSDDEAPFPYTQLSGTMCDVTNYPDDYNRYFGNAIQGTLRLVIQDLVTRLFDFQGPLPDCNPESIGGLSLSGNVCTPAQAVDWLAASMTLTKLRWFYTPFGEGNFSNWPAHTKPGAIPGWLPVKSVAGGLKTSGYQTACKNTDYDGYLDSNEIFDPDECSGFPDTLVFKFNKDPDSDGIDTANDPTPFCHGTSTTDSDGDGTPDACDKCMFDPLSPADPNHPKSTSDPDKDGLCWPTQDNCRFIRNHDQSNCNGTSEMARGAEALGDACDPDVCPQIAYASGSDAACDPQRTKFTIRPLGRHYEEQCPNQGDFTWDSTNYFYNKAAAQSPDFSQYPSLALQTFHSIKTTGWFCQEKPALGYYCDSILPNWQPLYNSGWENVVDDAWLTYGQSALNPWRQITMRINGQTFAPPNGPSLEYTGRPRVAQTPASPTTPWSWESAADIATWTADPLNPLSFPPYDPATGTGGLEGALWMHADAPPGRGLEGIYHPLFPTTQVAGLANSYHVHVYPTQGGCPVPPPKPPPHKLPFGAVSYQGTAIQWPALLHPPSGAYRRWDAVEGQTSLILPVSDSRFGAVDSLGEGENVTSRLSPALRARLANPYLKWINTAEPMLEMGAATAYPLAVAMFGTQIVDTVTTDGASLSAEADAGSVALDQGFFSAPVNGAIPVFTRMWNRVFLVGGTDAQGAPSGVWAAEVRGDRQWLPLVDTYVPTHAIAATFSFATDKIYVLDQVTTDMVALVSIDFPGGDSTVLASWPSSSAWDHSWLTTDLDGDLVLSLSSTSAQAHRLVVLDVTTDEGAATIKEKRDGGSVLAYPPIVDRAGITQIVLDDSGAPRAYPRTSLEGTQATWSDLASVPTITPTCVSVQRGLSGAVSDALIDAGSGTDGKADKNYGASNSLTASLDASGLARHALVRFDLGSVPSGAVVRSATATLSVLLYGGAQVRAHRITAPWDEATVTWSSFADAYTGNVEATFPAGSPTSASVTSLVQGWVDGAYDNDGLLLERDSGVTVFSSSEYLQSSRPRLDVCYVMP